MSRTIRKENPEYKGKDYETTRDRKKWFKSPKWFKKLRNKRRRAKISAAIRQGKEPPTFKHDNDWDWN